MGTGSLFDAAAGWCGHGLEVEIRHSVGSLALDVAFALTEPWTVLFAPSGAGKSTVLRVIAGLVRPDAGRLRTLRDGVPETVLLDTAAAIQVPAQRRGIRLVGQEAALFPHLRVRENVSYGCRTGSVDEVMALCRVAHLAGKMPSALSGGERQRVALARCLAASGSRAMLLDEPFSGLDVGLRGELIGEVKGWLRARGIPVLHVTHDVGEVFAVADEVLRLESGRIASRGRASEVLGAERQRLLVDLGG